MEPAQRHQTQTEVPSSNDHFYTIYPIYFYNKLDRLHLRGLKISKNIVSTVTENNLLYKCGISNLKNRRIVHLKNFMYNRKHLCKNNTGDENMVCTRANDGPLFHVEKPNCETYKRNVCYSGYLKDRVGRSVRDSPWAH